MTTDGGVEAVTGFVFQSMAALLDSLKDDDWSELAIDPMHDDGSCQKVDIEWKLKDGRVRVAQVKHSKNSIDLPAAKSWAEDLKQSRKADEYKLLLYAPTAGGVPKQPEWVGVKIEVMQGNIYLLWDALAFRVMERLRSGRFDPLHVRWAIRLMVGQTIVGIIEQTSWTRAALEELLLQLITSCERRPRAVGSHLTVSLLRVLRAAPHGYCDEYVCYTFRNSSDVPVELPVWSIFWTDKDASGIEILYVGEPPVPSPAYRELIHDDTGTFELEITPRSIVAPGAVGTLEVRLRQSHLIQPLGSPPSTWSFQDPLLGTGEPHQAEVFLIFPQQGTITAWEAYGLCSRTVHWKLMTGPGPRRLAALMQVNPAGVAVNEQLLAQLDRYFPVCRVALSP